MKHDPQENDPKLKMLIDAADREAAAILATQYPRNVFGVCHLFWKTKQQILLTKHGIEWRTPAEMNPDTIFD